MARLDKVYFGTNTKMFKTASESVKHIEDLAELTKDIAGKEIELFVMPPFTALYPAGKCKGIGIVKLGSQNVGWQQQGEFTGEISPVMLKEVGCTMVCIGHSERRHKLNETDEMENLKVICAITSGLSPVFCIGETKTQKEEGKASEVLISQLVNGLKNVTPEMAEKLIIAYEPVWAIGNSGTSATPEYAQMQHKVIKETLKKLFGETGSDIPVLYGGSVNNTNAPLYAQCEAVDGLFIGRSAWVAENFNAIIRDTLPIFKKRNK